MKLHPRQVLAAATIAAAVLAAAGCGWFDGDEDAPSPSAEPSVTSAPEVSASTPSDWEPQEPEQTAQPSTTPSATPSASDGPLEVDPNEGVVGEWTVNAPLDGESHHISIETATPREPRLGAQEYFDTVFGAAVEDGADLTHDVFLNEQGYEVLMVLSPQTENGPAQGEGSFLIFAPSTTIVGKLVSDSALSDAVVDQFREVAFTLVVN